MITVPISLGELVDKITILELKQEFIKNEDKLKNVNKELELLKQIPDYSIVDSSLVEELRDVNKILWCVEDSHRIREKENIFDEKFIELARMVYKTNDLRSELKKQINLKYNSELIEEKSYDD